MKQDLRAPARRAPWTALIGLVALSFTAPQSAPELDTREHQALARTISKYLDELNKDKGKEEAKEKAKEAIVDALVKIGKKQGEKDPDEALQVALRMTADLGRAMFYTGDYRSGLKSGTTMEELGRDKNGYGVSVPKGYKSNGGPYPLVLCIPSSKDGKVVQPMEFLTEELQDGDLRDGAILAVVSMPEDSSTWNGDDAIRAVMMTFGDVTRKAPIDVDRIYLLGRGEGVSCAMQIATRFPHRFAGVVGMAGDVGTVGYENFHNLPTLFQGAGAEATAFEAKIKEAGFNNCTIKPDATVADVWAWMQQTPRVSNPVKITLAPGTPIPNKAYWLEIPPTDGIQGVVTAEADRASNTIKINAEGVRSVSVYFNNDIVDLTRPVTIVLNGREIQEKVIASVDEWLSLFIRGTSDAGRVYVARRVYDVPS